MRTFGCLALLGLVGWLTLEVWAWLALSQQLNSHFEAQIGSGGYLLTIGWMILMFFLGVRFTKHHAGRIMAGLLTGQAGRHILGAIGGVLLALPGFISDIPGILLLLPPVQIVLGTLGNALVAAVVKQTMGRMMGGVGGLFGGGMPGGGMAGGFAGMFPGMQPRSGGGPAMKPDDQIIRPKRPKIIDTTVEKD